MGRISTFGTLAALAFAAATARADAPLPPAPPPAAPAPALEESEPAPPPVMPYYAPFAPAVPPPTRAVPQSGGKPHDTTLLLNAAALAGNPFASGRGWRIEAVVERRARGQERESSAVLLSAGEATVPGFAPVVAFGIAAQVRSYFAGNFDRGAYAGAQVGLWFLGRRFGVAPGLVVGLKSVTSLATVDLQLCAQWAEEFARVREPADAPFRDAWRALAPGLLVGVGLSI